MFKRFQSKWLSASGSTPTTGLGISSFRESIRNWTRGSAAWMVSLGLHGVALFLFASVTLLLPTDQRVLLTVTDFEPPEEVLPEEFHFDDMPHEEIGALGDTGLADARPTAPMVSDIAHLSAPTPTEILTGDLRVDQAMEQLLTAPEAMENLMVKGSGSVGTNSASGALDRITHEIMLSLDQSPTLVVWLFDRSGSLTKQRDEIVERLDRIYDELGVIASSNNPAFRRHHDKPLLTSVVAFGRDSEKLTPEPTDEVDEIKSAIRAVTEDDSGVENVFSAIGNVAQQFRRYRLKSPRRNVMIVVFTDEAGDDVAQLEKTVSVCRRYEMPVYVVGVTSPLGRSNAYVKYVDPDPNFDQRVQWVPVRQGPESLFPERIKLYFTGAGREDDVLDSGFGPFGLTRLTYETGGIFFMVHPNRRDAGRVTRRKTDTMSSYIARFFDPRIMRLYRPDYISVDDYRRLVESNRAASALIKAARMTWTLPMENPQREFPKIDDAAFARQLTTAQRDAAQLEPIINEVVAVLKEGEPDRPQLIKPRWQAGFDLAIGRALAVKVRTTGYNAMLAQAKMGMEFTKDKSDTWRIDPSTSIIADSRLQREAQLAQRYLTRVIEDHDETPWAYLAQRELATPLGWQWKEEFRDLVARAERAANNANRPRPERPPRPPGKPLRKPPRL